MKTVLFILACASFAQADLEVDGTVVQIESVRPDRSPGVLGDHRYRALLTDVPEGGRHLHIDKTFVDDEIRPVWEKKITYEKVEPVASAFKRVNPEQQMACCGITQVRWRFPALSFSLRVDNKSYSCKVEDVEKDTLKLSCK